MSPIFVRPVREQLEHDRLIRFLHTKYKKKFDVTANVGDEQLASVKIGANTFFPDLVITSGKKLAGLVEVESGESVNNLEAMAQWVHFAKTRAPFHLYVPVAAFDVARRLCEANQVRVSEIWTYRALMDGFDLMRGMHDPSAASAPPAQKPSKGPASKKRTPAKAPKKTVNPKKPVKKPAPKSKPKKTAPKPKKGKKR